MLKRISALILAIALLGGIQACQMPQNIFKDNQFSSDSEDSSDSLAKIYDFDFSLDKQEFELPISYSAMYSRGWKISEPAESGEETDDDAGASDVVAYTLDSVLAPDEYSDYVPLSKDGKTVRVRFWNNGKREKKISDCKVAGISLDYLDGEIPKFKLKKKDLSIGSKYDVVLNVCGKPSYIANHLKSTGELASINDIDFIESEEETWSTLVYKLTDRSFISFSLGMIDKNTNCVVKMIMENNVEDEKPYDYSKEQKYKPDNIDLFKGPHLLGKQFSDFAFKYEGNLYTLPIPVRTLMDDGWEFIRGYGERIPMGTTAKGLIMHKGNIAVSMLVHNYDTKYAHTAINCYVVSLEACITGPLVNIMMSKGVTLGSTEKELNDAFGKDYVKTHQIIDDEGNYLPATPDHYEVPGIPGCYIEKTVGEDYTVYSYVMPDDVPSIKLPVSITDIGDTGEALLGGIRKHIDVYVSNQTHMIDRFYLQNCPAYIVDEQRIIEEQMEAARRKEQEEWERKQREEQDGYKNEEIPDGNDTDETDETNEADKTESQ